MSKTNSRVYGREYRAGRKTRWWEKLMLRCRARRATVETWLTEPEEHSNTDFLVMLFSGLCLALAGVAVWAASRG